MDPQLPPPPASPPWGDSSSGRGAQQGDDAPTEAVPTAPSDGSPRSSDGPTPPPDAPAASTDPLTPPPDAPVASTDGPVPPPEAPLGPASDGPMPPPVAPARPLTTEEMPPPVVDAGPSAPAGGAPGEDGDGSSTAVRHEDGLLPLPLAARTRWRVQGAVVGLLLGLAAAVVPTGLLVLAVGPAAGVLAALFAVVGVVAGIVWANRRHERFGYALDAERLRVRDGVVIHSEVVAPLFRVQHVDLTRGPLQLSFGLASLSVRTASPAADVRLPDLRADDAEQVRDTILTASKAAAAALGGADVDAV